MKLYTEEHLKIFYHLGKIDGFIGREDDINELIKNYPPIELPSDEEIETKIENMEVISLEIEVGYIAGAIWMRDKIQGGNK